MSDAQLLARAWAPGTDFPDPLKMNWLYHFGLAVICILWTLSLIIIGLRMWARWTSKQIGVDDYLMLAAMAVNTGWFFTLVMYVKTCYVGIHYYDAPELSIEQKTQAKLYEWLIILLYHPVLGFVKASVLSFDQKFTGVKKSLRYTVYVLQTVNAGCMISIFSVTLFQCNPISLNWTPGYRRSCINNIAFNYAYNCIVIATDVAVLAVPFWAFIGLQMRTRLKIGILCVFGLGILVTVVSCIRLALLVNWFNQFYKGLGSKDIYYSFGWAISPIECNLAIIAASIPALWPLIRKTFPNLISETPDYSYKVNTHPRSTHHATAFRSTANRTARSKMNMDDEDDDAFMMKSMQGNGQVDCRPVTPAGSQDGIIDFKNGIVRTTDVAVDYEDANRDIDYSNGNGRKGHGRKQMAYAV